MPLFDHQPAIAKSEKEWHQDGNPKECGRCRDEREPAETKCVTQKCRRESQPGREQKNLIDPIHPLLSAYAQAAHNVMRVFSANGGAVSCRARHAPHRAMHEQPRLRGPLLQAWQYFLLESAQV
jgi:hypothetical protein